MKKHTLTDRQEGVEVKKAASATKPATCIHAIKLRHTGKSKKSGEEKSGLKAETDNKVLYFDMAADSAARTGTRTQKVLIDKRKRVVQKKKQKAIKDIEIKGETKQRSENERFEKELEKHIEKEKEKLEKEKKKFEVIIISSIIGCIIVCGPITSGEIIIDSELSLKSMLNAFAEGALATAIIAVIGLISGAAVKFWAMPSKLKVMKYIKIAIIVIVLFVGISYAITQVPAYHLPD
ncbi:MAG: hypothetical protein ACOX4R_06225 [Lentihominibacter sp.]|jgi:hypothetical protein